MFLIDSHCHIDKLDYCNLHLNVDDVLHKANIKNVRFFLAVSTDLFEYNNAINIAGHRSDVMFSCGIHPCNLNKSYSINKLYDLASNKSVIALGETGLDYYHQTNNKILQQQALREHIYIARQLRKPLIIHTRHAYQDTLEILRAEKSFECGGVIHCFNEDIVAAKSFIDLGFFISFSGLITFNQFKWLDDVIRYIPLDYLLIETDAPYLTPVPYRGKENQPAYVYYVGKYVATLKSISLEKLSFFVVDNFNRLFHVDTNKYIYNN